MAALHVTSVILALATGTVILLWRKGTTRHRILGRAYVLLLLTTAIGSFWIMELRNGRPSVFHGVSLLVSILIVAGVVALRQGRVRGHALLMASSVLVTAITGIAQFFDQLPLGSDALNAIVFLQLPSIVGFALIWQRTARPRVTGG